MNGVCADSKLQIRDRLLVEKAERKILCHLYGQHKNVKNPKRVKERDDARTVANVSRMDRIGLSGAKVYNVRFAKDHLYISKFGKAGKIKDEFSRIKKMDGIFLDELGSAKFDQVEKTAGILYPNLMGRDPEEEKAGWELEEAVRSVIDDNPSRRWRIDQLQKAVEKLYQNTFRTAHGQIKYSEHSLLHWYSKGPKKKYLREEKSTDRIWSALGRQAGARKGRWKKFVKHAGKKMVNPLWALNKTGKKPQKVAFGPVHGDLHGRNVIFDRDGKSHIIDFAWAERQGHVLVDFVLLENTLRFFLMPKCIHRNDRHVIDEALLNEKGWRTLLSGKNWQSSSREVDFIKRTGIVIKAIRQQARRVLAPKAKEAHCKYNFHEYLVSQFFLLYGVMQYSECDFTNALSVLCMIATKLKSKKFR
jgi:Ternary complex associated domain 9